MQESTESMVMLTKQEGRQGREGLGQTVAGGTPYGLPNPETMVLTNTPRDFPDLTFIPNFPYFLHICLKMSCKI